MSEVNETERQCFSFLWKIENFNHCLQKRNESLDSPSFVVNGMSSTEWRLLLYPRGTDDENKIAIYLHRVRTDRDPLAITVDFELSFLARDESVLKMAELNKHVFEGGDGYGIPMFIARDDVVGYEKKDYLSADDTLTVRCRLWKSNTSLLEAGECTARTHIPVERGACKWAISDFSNLPANKQMTLVVERSSESDPPLSVDLYLSGGCNNDRKVSIDISLCKVNRGTFSTCRVSVLDSHGRFLDSSENEHWFEAKEEKQVWKLHPFLKKSYLLSKKHLYLPKDVLSLQFEFGLSVGDYENNIEYHPSNSVSVPPSPTPSPSPTPLLIQPPELQDASTQVNSQKLLNNLSRHATPLRDYSQYSQSFVHDLHCLYDERVLCDFAFRAGAEIFPVHKCVLGARSPVFRAMFTNEMAEGTNVGEVLIPLDIPDLDAETMHSLLTFIYTDNLQGEVTWEGAYKLYFAADKYAVQSLKFRCASFLAAGLSPSNVCRLLSLADMHQDEGLKRAAQEFVMNNDALVLRSEEWKALEQEDIELAFETMREVYLKRLQI